MSAETAGQAKRLAPVPDPKPKIEGGKPMASIAWSFSVGDAAGAGVTSNGVAKADAVTTAFAHVDAGASRELALQIADVSRVALLVATCNRYDGSVSLKGGKAGDPTLNLTGPIMAFGEAASRLAASLGTITIAAAADPDRPASVSFFVATTLT